MISRCKDCANGRPLGGRMVFCAKRGEMQPELYCCEYWKSRTYPPISLAIFLDSMLHLIPKCDIVIKSGDRLYEIDRSDHIFYSKDWEEIRHNEVQAAELNYDSDLHHYILSVTVV